MHKEMAKLKKLDSQSRNELQMSELRLDDALKKIEATQKENDELSKTNSEYEGRVKGLLSLVDLEQDDNAKKQDIIDNV